MSQQQNSFYLDDENCAVEKLWHAREVVERHWYELDNEALSSHQLFKMRIELRDACDTIMLATRHIERMQRYIAETEKAE
jgi:hypothetical protein